MSRVCSVCNVNIDGLHHRRVTCSVHCSNEKEKARRRAKTLESSSCRSCVSCGSSLRGRRSDTMYCSQKCEYQFNADIKRDRCRSWRERHPDRQAASSKRWADNNRENHLSMRRRASQKWRDNNPGVKAMQSREYRKSSPRPAEYAAERVAAYKTVRLIEKYGLDALKKGFSEPPISDKQQKQRKYKKRWRDKNPEYKPSINEGSQKKSQAKHNSRETAALNFMREVEKKGFKNALGLENLR